MRKKVLRAAGLLAALVFVTNLAPEPQLFRITFLGDVMLGRGIQIAADRSKDWHPFRELEPITRWSDVLAANLESPLTIAPPQTDGYMLCARPNMVSALQNASFDLLTLANNHILDCGQTGMEQTRLTLSSLGIHPVGPDPQPVYINLRGRLAGFIALDDVSRAVDVPTVLPLVEDTARMADPLIVSIHWGSEYQPTPAPRQRALASMLANAGVDVIIGHHPHVIQPMEFLPRGTDQPPTLVFYSLGNALFDQHGLPNTRTGALVNLNFGPGGAMLYSVEIFEIDPVKGLILPINP